MEGAGGLVPVVFRPRGQLPGFRPWAMLFARSSLRRLDRRCDKFFDRERYELRAWVVMPNHVHAVVRPNPAHTLSQILHSWKSFTAHAINKLLPQKVVPFWQNESYDHLIRDEDDLQRCSTYTLMNPLDAGLCAEPQLWPWSSAYVAQPSPAAGSSTVPVRGGGGTPP